MAAATSRLYCEKYFNRRKKAAFLLRLFMDVTPLRAGDVAIDCAVFQELFVGAESDLFAPFEDEDLVAALHRTDALGDVNTGELGIFARDRRAQAASVR